MVVVGGVVVVVGGSVVVVGGGVVVGASVRGSFPLPFFGFLSALGFLVALGTLGSLFFLSFLSFLAFFLFPLPSSSALLTLAWRWTTGERKVNKLGHFDMLIPEGPMSGLTVYNNPLTVG